MRWYGALYGALRFEPRLERPEEWRRRWRRLSAGSRVELGIRFGISPARTNSGALWKTTIDALGGILGDGGGTWNPNDDRISLLVLEREFRLELGWDVQVDVWWAENT